MARRKKGRTKRHHKKVSVFWPVFIVILGLILFTGGYWLFKILSEGEGIKLPEIKVGEQTTREINLYFSSADAKKLVIEKREILQQPNLVEETREVIEELIRGPRDKNLTKTLPPQTKLRSLFLDFNEATAYVDFTETISRYSSGGSTGEVLSVYSVTNSIIDNFPEVKLVKILINGEEKETLNGHIDLTRPIGFNEGLIQGK